MPPAEDWEQVITTDAGDERVTTPCTGTIEVPEVSPSIIGTTAFPLLTGLEPDTAKLQDTVTGISADSPSETLNCMTAFPDTKKVPAGRFKAAVSLLVRVVVVKTRLSPDAPCGPVGPVAP